MGFAHVPGALTDRRTINELLTERSSEKFVTKLNALGGKDRKIFFFISKQFVGPWEGAYLTLTLLRQNNPDGVSLGFPPDSRSSVSTPLLNVVEFDLGGAYLYEITTAEAMR